MSVFDDDMEAENKAIVEQHDAGWWERKKDAEIDRLHAELKSLEGLYFVAKCKLIRVTAENALLWADAERLDCGQIMISTLDEFGEPKQVWHTGMNLRAAIDAAMAQGDKA